METKKKKTHSITDEDIEKAFQELAQEAELEKAQAEDEESKVILDEENDGENDEEVEFDFEDDEQITKAKRSEDYDDDDDDEDEEDEEEEMYEDDEEDEEYEEEEMNKNKKKGKKFKKAMNPAIKKGIEVSDFLKGLVDDINHKNEEVKNVLGNVAILLKSLNERVEELEEQLNAPRAAKSKISKASVHERFTKAADEETNAMNNNVVKIDDYKRVLNILDEAAGLNRPDGNIDLEFAKAITTFEARKILPRQIIERLRKEKGIIIEA